MSYLVVDTDVASAIVRDRMPSKLHARLAGHTVCMTFVTLGELTKWTQVRSWGPRRLGRLHHWSSQVLVLGYNQSVSLVWGQLQAHGMLRGRPRPVNDTWIAACCIADGLPLATFNTKDYADMAAHDNLQLIDVGSGPTRPGVPD